MSRRAKAAAGAVVLLLARPAWAGPPPPTPLDEGRPVGGYWAPGERPQPEPPDGHWNIVVGSILVPLGAIGTGAAAAGMYVTDPSRCQELTNLDAKSCDGYFAFSIVRVAYSGLMLVAGSVILGIGLSQRTSHREWKRMRNFTLAPMPLRRGGGVGLALRF